MKITIKRVFDVLAISGNIIGAYLVAIGQHNTSLSMIGYACFLVGSLSSIWLLRHSNASTSLVFINIYFTVINVIGILARI
jgi:hypothetical protein